jgi:hypothetical protein
MAITADRSKRPHRAPSNKFASGRNALVISDRSGLEFPYNEMRFEWTGMLVHNSEYEPKQPQLDLTYFTDAQSLQNARPQVPNSKIGGVPDQIQLLYPNTSGAVLAVGVAQASTNLLSTSLGNVTVVT